MWINRSTCSTPRGEVYDTFGNLTAKIRPDKGLGRIEVPRSGYVKLNYE